MKVFITIDVGKHDYQTDEFTKDKIQRAIDFTHFLIGEHNIPTLLKITNLPRRKYSDDTRLY